MKRFQILFFLFLILPALALAQNDNKDDDDDEKDIHEFTILYSVDASPVKSQDWTGTCWSFATTSFIESELLRMDKGELDISDMYFVRYAYPTKAEKYVRYHGNNNFGQGGQAHDVMNVMREHGMVTEDAYTGKNIGEEKHNHAEMATVLQAMLDGVLKVKGKKLTPRWKDAFRASLDAYLGDVPETFEYEGTEYTPEEFRDELGINPDDYIEIISYTNYPMYEPVVLEVPDNWSDDLYYNVPLEDLMGVIDNALMNGYSVCWDGDTGKDNFYRKKGYAVIPEDNEDKDDDEEITEPEVEKEITVEMRQKAFDNFDATDDHLMHLTGIAENQEGTKFYYTKNSWGTKDKKYDGYWYMSEPYLRLKTIAIMVHKDAVPEEIRTKLGF